MTDDIPTWFASVTPHAPGSSEYRYAWFTYQAMLKVIKELPDATLDAILVEVQVELALRER